MKLSFFEIVCLFSALTFFTLEMMSYTIFCVLLAIYYRMLEAGKDEEVDPQRSQRPTSGSAWRGKK